MTQQPAPVVQDRTWLAQRSRYFVLRVTGVLLTVLVLGHFALTHIVHDVAETDSSFIAERWSSALWVTWDGLMLGAAFVHAVAGLLVVVRDLKTDRAARRRWLTVLLGLSLVLLILGATTLTYGALA